jgi:hypothetical protein
MHVLTYSARDFDVLPCGVVGGNPNAWVCRTYSTNSACFFAKKNKKKFIHNTNFILQTKLYLNSKFKLHLNLNPKLLLVAAAPRHGAFLAEWLVVVARRYGSGGRSGAAQLKHRGWARGGRGRSGAAQLKLQRGDWCARTWMRILRVLLCAVYMQCGGRFFDACGKEYHECVFPASRTTPFSTDAR